MGITLKPAKIFGIVALVLLQGDEQKTQRVSLWVNFENQKQHIGPLNAK